MDELEKTFIAQKSEEFVLEGEEVGEEEQRPEDSIPDLPENQAAREFLKNAPTRGLHMPLGKEVKVMQCWRCKAYGHRSGDRECPMRVSGNRMAETIRQTIEDPMSFFVESKLQQREEKYARVDHLKALIADIRVEEEERRKRKRLRDGHGESAGKGKKHKKEIKKVDKKQKKHKNDRR